MVTRDAASSAVLAERTVQVRQSDAIPSREQPPLRGGWTPWPGAARERRESDSREAAELRYQLQQPAAVW